MTPSCRAAGLAPSLVMGALALFAAAPALTQTPYDVFLERTAMLAAGGACRLFDARTIAALSAAQAQARTASLRAGFTPQALDRGTAQARQAVGAMACNSPHVQQAADRARSAFHTYSGLRSMAFPGDVGGWQANRVMPLKSAAWRLSQDAFAGQDKVVFGVAGQDGAEAVTLAVAPNDGPEPYAARLIVRDQTRLPQPFLTPSSAPLSARIPLRAASRVVMAEARSDADPALRPSGARKAVAFRFPQATSDVLAGLDPREAVSVELLYPSSRGEMVRTAFVEVGDFDAARAFLKAGPSR